MAKNFEPTQFRWFLWCVHHYTDETCKREAARLTDLGRYYGVKIQGHRVWLNHAVAPNGALRDKWYVDAFNAIRFDRPYTRAWWGSLRRLDKVVRIDVVVDAHMLGLIDDWQLWDVCSSHQTPLTAWQAEMVYKTLGFVPFAGYPLQRSELCLVS